MKPNPFPALNHLTVPVSFITSLLLRQQLEAGVSMRMGSDLGNPQALSAHMKTCVMLKTSLILAFRWVVPGRRVSVGSLRDGGDLFGRDRSGRTATRRRTAGGYRVRPPCGRCSACSNGP